MAVSAGSQTILSCSSDDSTYNIIGGINSISFAQQRTDLDTTEFNFAYKTRILGLKKGRTVTISGAYSAADTGQARVRTLFASGADMYFQVDWDGASGTVLDNQVVKVQRYEIASKSDGLVTFSATLQFSGAGDTTHHAEAAYTAITPISGHATKVEISSNGSDYYTLNGIRSVSFSYDRNFVDNNDFASTSTAANEFYAPGHFTGSIKIDGALMLDASGQALFRSGWKNAANRYLKVYWNGTAGHILQFLPVTIAMSGDFTSECKFNGDGPLQAAPTTF